MTQRDDVYLLSPEAQYVLFNFQRPDDLSALGGLLGRDDDRRPPIVVLSGEAGGGRRYFLQSAIHRAGRRIASATIDLAGYEIGRDSLERYALTQLEKAPDADRPRISEVLDGLKLTVTSPSVLSIALKLDLPIGEILSVFKATHERIPLAVRTEREVLHRLLKSLTANARLALHVRDSAEITDLLRGWLLDEAEINRSLVLVFSCHPHDTNAQVAPSANVRRFEIGPLNVQELRDITTARFPNSFPDRFFQVLWDNTRGVQARIATKMADLVRSDCLRQDAAGEWHLPADDLRSPELAAVFYADSYEPIRSTLASLSGQTRERIAAFLQAAALCPEQIPVNVVLTLCGIPECDSDDVIDILDERFDPPLFIDCGYQHPSFPAELVYIFRSPITAAVILDHLDGHHIRDLSRRFLDLLRDDTREQTRGSVRLMLALASRLDSGEERALYLRDLGWWIAANEVDALGAHLTAAFQDGALEPASVVRETLRRFEAWPIYKSLVFLEAVSQHEVDLPVHMAADFHICYARALLEMDRIAACQNEALKAMPFVTNEPLREAALLKVVGDAHMKIDEVEEAFSCFERVLGLTEGALGQTHPAVANALIDLGSAHSRLGRGAEAERLDRLALAIYAETVGPRSLEVAECLTRLTFCLFEQPDKAKACLTAALEIVNTTQTRNDVATAVVLRLLAYAALTQRLWDDAFALLKRALAIRETTLGSEHSSLAEMLHEIAILSHFMHRPEEYEPLLKRALAITEKNWGPVHEHTANVLHNLGAYYQKEGRQQEGERLLQRSLAIREQVWGPDRSRWPTGPRTVTEDTGPQ